MERTRRRGFTLIELLVVVAIISLLAAIAIPNVAGRLRKARMTKAEADIKNIETAVEMFRTDTGYLPFYALNTKGWTALAGLGYNQVTDVCRLYTIGMLEAILKTTKLYANPPYNFFKGGVADTVQRTYMPKGISLDPWKGKYTYVERQRNGGLTCIVPQIRPEILTNQIDLDYYIYSRGEDQLIFVPPPVLAELEDVLDDDIYETLEYQAEPVVNDDVSNWDINRTYQTAYL